MSEFEILLSQSLPAAATFAGAAFTGGVMLFVSRLVKKNKAKTTGIRLQGGIKPQYQNKTGKRNKKR
jgi:hypothetical protein